MAGSSNNIDTGALYFGSANPTVTGQEVDNDSYIVTSDGTSTGTPISFWKFDEETLTWVIVPSGDLNNDRVLYTGNTTIPTLAPPKGVDTAVLSNGTRYDWDGTVWVVQPGAIFDSTVDFSVNTNPNTAGTTFTPNTPASTTVLYVSTIDGSQWTYNGTNYVTAPVSSDWKVTGNIGTVQATNFLGTTDNIGLSFRTNNIIRQTINNNGNVGIGITNPTTLLNVQNTAGTNANVALFKSLNGGGGYAVRGESVNSGSATGVYGELGVWDGTHWSGVRGNSGVSNMPAIKGINSVIDGVSGFFDQNVGVGNSLPQAKLSLRGVDQTVVLAAARNFPATLHLDNPNDAVGAQQNILFTASYSGVNSSNKVAVGSIGTIREVNGTNADYGQSSLVFRTTGNTIASLNTEKMRITGIGNVGIGITTPTSNIHINGSEAGSITNITATTALNATHHKILVSNAAVNITITLPDALTCLGREYIFSRAAGSTGSITIQRTGTNVVQALNGTTGATTSIGLHSATGGGLRHSFTAVNIGGVGVWVRI